MKEVLYIIKQEELDWIKGELHEIKSLVAEGKKKSNTQDELLDAQAAAAMLHITPRCLYNWTKKRLLPYVQIGRRRLYSKKVLQGLIDSNTLNCK